MTPANIQCGDVFKVQNAVLGCITLHSANYQTNRSFFLLPKCIIQFATDNLFSNLAQCWALHLVQDNCNYLHTRNISFSFVHLLRAPFSLDDLKDVLHSFKRRIFISAVEDFELQEVKLKTISVSSDESNVVNEVWSLLMRTKNNWRQVCASILKIFIGLNDFTMKN